MLAPVISFIATLGGKVVELTALPKEETGDKPPIPLTPEARARLIDNIQAAERLGYGPDVGSIFLLTGKMPEPSHRPQPVANDTEDQLKAG